MMDVVAPLPNVCGLRCASGASNGVGRFFLFFSTLQWYLQATQGSRGGGG